MIINRKDHLWLMAFNILKEAGLSDYTAIGMVPPGQKWWIINSLKLYPRWRASDHLASLGLRMN